MILSWKKNLRQPWRCHVARCGSGHVGGVDARYAERWADHPQRDEGRQHLFWTDDARRPEWRELHVEFDLP